MVFDVSEAEFPQKVVERSREVPVVVDFWAEWCGPCRTLGPTLEKAANDREGRVELAKLDVDANQAIARAFRVQGIPAVKAFKDGRVASEFTGAIPPAQVEQFFDALLPSEAEVAAAAALESGDEDTLRAALDADPRNGSVAAALARLLIAGGDNDEALRVAEPFEHDFAAAGVAARARLTIERAEDEHLAAAFEAWDADDAARALEELQQALAQAPETETRDAIRRVMIAIFTELGPDSELAREHRRRLSAVLN
ncbi:MAG: putative thioredoxin [Thermoleophilaceae bacterium]|nr:putative thioredoxin [Thermoleophilaceae bacterium]